MCEWYFDVCQEPSCVRAAQERAVKDRRKYGEEFYQGRTGSPMFLYKGYSGPCTHIAKSHGPECHVVKKYETEYGWLYDTCNCEADDEKGWVYY